MEVLDAARMQKADREAIEGMSIPGLILMENAGRLVAESLVDEFSAQHIARVVVFAGMGNNGGDGFVVARHLARMGRVAELFLIGGPLARLRGDAATMATAWVGLGGAVVEVESMKAWEALEPGFTPGDLIVDALFGTGLTRPLEGLAERVVSTINAAGVPVIAVDLPSGLDASIATLPGPCVRADLTVTFGRPKPAQILPPAEDYCGTLSVVDIGIPPAAVQAAQADLHWVTPEDAALLLPERHAEDHKGVFGHVLSVAGSAGKAGAAALTGWGALRVGAGLSTVASPSSPRPEIAGFAPELMTEALPEGSEGTLAKGAHSVVLGLVDSHTVLAVGPGLSTQPVCQTEIRRLVQKSPLPVVLDADGINAFAGRYLTALAKRRASLILTPHPGEAARLLGVSAEEIQFDRVASARRIAKLCKGVCVLKGYRTITADPDGLAVINSTGNPGMASGGMGDLLTGMIAGLLAQGLEGMDAAILGVYLHSLAADLALEANETEATLTASAVALALPEAFHQLAEADRSAGD